ncbi:MAG: hypothetical protein MJ062_04535 [Oscillospiraceae bacterium]|nr:hypothetical protein [Oscillospiraceae bacterium]
MNEITTRILDYLVLLFAVVLASSIIYHLFNQDYKTETAIYAEVSDVSKLQGVYVRSETEKSYSGSGAVRYCVSDGAKLGVGSVIAEVYDSEEQIDLRRSIAKKQDELSMLTKVENPGTSDYAQPANLSTLIEEQYKTMLRLREVGDYSSMLERKREMTVLMSTYDKITGQSDNLQSRITELQDEISMLELRLTEPMEKITAEKSAYFVSYVDGYEKILTPQNMAQLRQEQLAEVTDGGPPNAERSPNVIGKLIDGYEWYIVGVFDNTKLRLSEGDSATVRLESVSDDLHAEVVSLVSAGDITKTQVILRCETLTYDVVQHRTERVEILRKTVEGVKVPRTAIRFQKMPKLDEEGKETDELENCMGVYVLVGENAEFRKIEIVYEDEEYYLSSLNAGNGYVALYDDIIVNGVMADGD